VEFISSFKNLYFTMCVLPVLPEMCCYVEYFRHTVFYPLLCLARANLAHHETIEGPTST
jgi:hypothetical protein